MFKVIFTRKTTRHPKGEQITKTFNNYMEALWFKESMKTVSLDVRLEY